MVQTLVKTLKSTLLLITAGVLVAACSDERGFRAKPFPTDGDEIQATNARRGKHKVRDAGDNKGPEAPVDRVVPKTPEEAATDAAEQDEFIDSSAKLLAAMVEPGLEVSKETVEKFKQNLTAEKAARAKEVILGLTIDVDKEPRQGNEISLLVKAVINDDGVLKSFSAKGRVAFTAETLVELQEKQAIILVGQASEDKATNIQVFGKFCLTDACRKAGVALPIVMLQVPTSKGDVVIAFFRQEMSKDRRKAILRSTYSGNESVVSFEEAMKNLPVSSVERTERPKDSTNSRPNGEGGRAAPVEPKNSKNSGAKDTTRPNDPASASAEANLGPSRSATLSQREEFPVEKTQESFLERITGKLEALFGGVQADDAKSMMDQDLDAKSAQIAEQGSKPSVLPTVAPSTSKHVEITPVTNPWGAPAAVENNSGPADAFVPGQVTPAVIDENMKMTDENAP